MWFSFFNEKLNGPETDVIYYTKFVFNFYFWNFECEYNKKGVVNYGKNAMCDSVRIQSMHKEQ